MPRQPVLFVSHGAPTLSLEPGPTAGFLRDLGRRLLAPGEAAPGGDAPGGASPGGASPGGGPPRAVLCFSAHWEADRPGVTLADWPGTIHDFQGFPEELYRLSHRAPGDLALAEHALGLLGAAGIDAEGEPSRGLDHGAWVPMKLMDPEATLPVVQVAIATARGARFMFDVGRALAPLRDEGVLILGSGGATHNLREFGRHAYDAPPAAWARAFDDWLRAVIENGRTDELLDWERNAPDARRNHPTHEHFLPLIAASGAAAGTGAGPGAPRGRRLHAAFTYGVLSMASFAWEA